MRAKFAARALSFAPYFFKLCNRWQGADIIKGRVAVFFTRLAARGGVQIIKGDAGSGFLPRIESGREFRFSAARSFAAIRHRAAPGARNPHAAFYVFLPERQLGCSLPRAARDFAIYAQVPRSRRRDPPHRGTVLRMRGEIRRARLPGKTPRGGSGRAKSAPIPARSMSSRKAPRGSGSEGPQREDSAQALSPRIPQREAFHPPRA